MAAEATPLPRIYPPVTRGESLNVISWVLLCVTLLAKISRFGTKYAIIGKFECDDLVALLALFFSAGLTIAISLQTANGLGSHFGGLPPGQQVSFQKASYAVNILFVATMWAGKSATVWQMQQIMPFSWRYRLSQGVNVLLGLWAFTALLASGLQCSPPRWQFVHTSSCANRAALFTYVDISNLITEIVIVVLPFVVLSEVKIPLQRKVTILSCFMLRSSVVVAIIAQLAYSEQGIYASPDPTFDYWKPTICLQVIQNLCVMSCSIPYLNPFYMGLQSGLIRSDDLRRTGLSASDNTQGSGDGRVSNKSNNGQVVKVPEQNGSS